MNPLSTSATVAGLLSLVITVVDSTYHYISSVRNAPAAVSSLFAELNNLKAVLLRFYELTHDTKFSIQGLVTENHTFLSSMLNMDACKAELESLQRKVSKRSSVHGAARVLRDLTWPFMESETLQLAQKLHRYGEIFSMALAADNFAINKTTFAEVRGLRNDMEQDSKRKAILKWLCPGPSSAVQDALRSQRQKDTGSWFLHLVQSKWLGKPPASKPVFWCKAGAGKTILTSLVVDYASSTQNKHGIQAVACIYYNYKQQDSQSTSAVFSSLLCQLLNQLPECWQTVEDLFGRHTNGTTPPNLEELVEIFQLINEPSKILLTIDALDEAGHSSRDSLLKQLKMLAKLSIRVFLTSRPDVDLGDLKELALIVDVTASEMDLRRYARSRLEESSAVQDVLEGQSETTISDIVDLIVSQASGMFLLVVFQTDYVCQQTSLREMLEAASKMPSNPSMIYSRTMEQINLQSPPQARLAKRILSWLMLAFQSLTPRVLIEALAIEPDTSDLDPLNKRSVTMLARVCRGLIIVDAENDIVQLAHKTVQEYLFSSGILDLPSMEHEIFMSCITYLSYDCCRQKDHSTLQEIYWRRRNYPFQTYAAAHLGDHLYLLPESDALIYRVYSFVTCPPLTDNYLQMRNVSRITKLSKISFSNVSAGMSPLHIAAIIGNAGVVRLVLERLPDLLNRPDSHGVTALQWAVYCGYEGVVQALLDADADTMCDHEESLLNYAARTGCDGIVRLLLQHEVSRRLKDSHLQAEQERGSDLILAAMTNNDTLVDEILEKGVNVDVRDSDGGTALQWAAWYDHTGIIQKLIDKGADVEAGDLTSGRRALHEAAENGCSDAVEILLAKGANADATDRWSWTPLHRAAFKGGSSVTELLLSYRGDIDARTMHGQTALHLACENAQVDTIRLLIERGISVENFDLKDVTFMMTISESRRDQVVKLLSSMIPRLHKPEKGERWRRILAKIKEAQVAQAT